MKTNTCVITGAGFSKVSGVPSTRQLTKSFLHPPGPSASPAVQSEITRFLREYWHSVFSYTGRGSPPSFEDHFTLLDLAANTGHHLGKAYSPSALRAIRRLSIHRVFEILDSFSSNSSATEFLNRLANDGDTHTLISTNWDIVAEKYLHPRRFSYGGSVLAYDRASRQAAGAFKVEKLHGSSNWLYCDSCQRTFSGPIDTGKTTTRKYAFLEVRDFERLNASQHVRREVEHMQVDRLRCPDCAIPLSARVATFSYSKALGFNQFHLIWADALDRLRQAERWIMIGYSLPESDYRLRQMLKIAELAHGVRPLKVIVVTKGKADIARYRRFFGKRLDRGDIEDKGFEEWWRKARRRPTFRRQP